MVIMTRPTLFPGRETELLGKAGVGDIDPTAGTVIWQPMKTF